jgi:hypothetical protein
LRETEHSARPDLIGETPVVRRRTEAWACALGAALLLALTGCGGSGTAAASKDAGPANEKDQLAGMVSQVKKMGIIEWHGQLLTKKPEDGGKRIFDLDGRYSPGTGYTQLSMDSVIDGKSEQVDYLVVNGRTYFNSDAWGPTAATCFADITDKPAYSWALPTDLDPTWPVAASRALRLLGDGVEVKVPAKDVITGMPRGLFPRVPAALEGIEATAEVTPHGHLVEVGVDVVNMWNDVPKAELADIRTRNAGWWAMTMKESQDAAPIAPPTRIFDPAVTPPSRCKRG